MTQVAQQLKKSLGKAYNQQSMNSPFPKDVGQYMFDKTNAIKSIQSETEDVEKSDDAVLDLINRIVNDMEEEEMSKEEAKEATGAASAGGYSAPLFGKPQKRKIKEEEEESEDSLRYNFNRPEYDSDSRTIVAAYMVGQETPKQLEVFNIKQYSSDDSLFMSGHKPYRMTLHKTMLPLSQIEVLGDVPNMDGFKYIRLPYWLYKKKDDLKIQRIDGPRLFLPRDEDYIPKFMDKFLDPMFEKYFKETAYDNHDIEKYENMVKNYERKKSRMNEDVLKNGLADDMTLDDMAKHHNTDVKRIIDELEKGVNVEMEHTSDMSIAVEIAMDHIYEDLKYYDKLAKMEGGSHKEESKEATTSSSVGVYDAPIGGGRKDPLQIDTPKSVYSKLRSVQDPNFPKYGGKGGKYVKIKEKCKKFPYCNQGDIKALEFFENNLVKEAIKRVTSKYNVDETYVKSVILERLKK